MSEAPEPKVGPNDSVSEYFQSEDADLILRARPSDMPTTSTSRYLPDGQDLSKYLDDSEAKCRIFRVKKSLLASSSVLRDMSSMDPSPEHVDKKPRISDGEVQLPVFQLEERGDVLELFLRYLSEDMDILPTIGDLDINLTFGVFEAAAKYMKPVMQQLAEARLITLLPRNPITMALEIQIRAIALRRTTLAKVAAAVVRDADSLKLPVDLLKSLPTDKQSQLSRGYIERCQNTMSSTARALEQALVPGKDRETKLRKVVEDAIDTLLEQGREH